MSAFGKDPRRVALVVPTWNGGPRFLEVLDALARQDLADGFQLVVVDSGSTDGTPQAAERAGALVHRIPNTAFNHGATRNLGISITGGEIVALLTQDALPMDANYLASLVAAYDDPAVDGAYARQFPRSDCDPLLAERLRQWSAARDTPETKSFAPGDPAGAQRAFDALPPLERYLACAFDNVASSVRRSSWERVPFPAASFGEDVAWARATLLAGGTLAFVPDARVEHSHRISMRREFQRIYCDHRNLIELFGLHNVPTWKNVFEGWAHQRRFYRELLAGLGLGPLRGTFWRAYSVPYAFLETAAQFLGARSHWKTKESAFWAAADRKIRAGV